MTFIPIFAGAELFFFHDVCVCVCVCVCVLNDTSRRKSAREKIQFLKLSNPKYKKVYPDARNLLLNSLPVGHLAQKKKFKIKKNRKESEKKKC